MTLNYDYVKKKYLEVKVEKIDKNMENCKIEWE